MKPAQGMTGSYFSLKCSLRVEVISYEESDVIERIRLKVLKKLNDNPECRYEENYEFVYERKKSGSEDNLEGLILD